MFETPGDPSELSESPGVESGSRHGWRSAPTLLEADFSSVITKIYPQH
jgi:hypothetical protein